MSRLMDKLHNAGEAQRAVEVHEEDVDSSSSHNTDSVDRQAHEVSSTCALFTRSRSDSSQADSNYSPKRRTRHVVSIYRNRGSDSDPPCSIAICPNQKAIAFGCKSGIELHWIDEEHSQDFYRWIEQDGAASNLHFLPPRVDVDTEQHLRLLSSLDWPPTESSPRFGENVSYALGAYTTRQEQRIIAGPDLLRDDLTPSTHPTSSVSHGFHNALPLSDGAHILITDPATHLLCLGTTYIRLFYLVPPECLNRPEYTSQDGLPCNSWGVKPPAPTHYRAANDLSSGPKIVAAYGDTLVLYSVPPDAFNCSPAFDLDDQVNSEWMHW